MAFYTGDTTYDTVLALAFAFVAFVAIGAWFIPSPYGRFTSQRYGFRMNPRVGWFLMELPASLTFLHFYFRGPRRFELVPLIFLLVWIGHYANRGFFFPFSIRSPKGATASFSITVVAAGWFATGLHGYLNGAFISTFASHLNASWLTDPRFVAGLVIYYSSYVLNVRSDATLRNLRTRQEIESGEKHYRIPRGGLFEYVSCPNYFTELTGWAGFALATWSLGGVFILTLSAANLVPRAMATHRWYREKFSDYPEMRKALIPFVW
jgi:3-oxo-5-alpha-steroid 4-dehydrogenase 1